jgi:Na+/serine symporter
MSNVFDFSEIVKRIVKYLIEGIIVAIVAYSIPKHRLNLEEVVVIALSAAATFSILDVFMGGVSNKARDGLGYGIGLKLAGFGI